MPRQKKRNLAKRIALSFLIAATAFGIPMGWFHDGNVYDRVVVGITSGILYGGILTLLFFFMEKRYVKKLGFVEGETKINHSTDLQVNCSYEEAFQACLDSLKTFDNYSVLICDRNKGNIVIATGVTWKSWGEQIEFEIMQGINGSVSITISSKPRVKTTIFDYGKNASNINAIAKALKS